ncbi:hypothetical protein C3Z09_22225 [Lelliottia aquatilis]|uniref:hypothetical protein n=1 Tax=Lelliottia aquatilis TaxID=2080838 RepID=UPI000CDF2D8F|nr:hypothetical protein [Lelliottia aquatilis]POZ13659.1 hypothetical protein C3Z09_22225 [Lelliottia aquatilis]
MAHPYVFGAVRWCQNANFCKFLADKLQRPVTDKESAAGGLRQLCGINSRAELATNERARTAYEALLNEFNQFMKGGQR